MKYRGIRAIRVVVLALIPIALLATYFLLPRLHVCRFLWGSDQYHSQVADACTVLLQEHPLGTNKWITLPKEDLDRLPAIMKELHISSGYVGSDSLHLISGGAFVMFRINWTLEPDKVWQLEFEGEEQIYHKTVHRRPVTNNTANK